MQRFLITAALLGATLAAPCQKKSDGFNLRVQLNDPTRDLTPSVSGQYLSGLRVSQGSYIAVTSEEPSTYYLNNTEGGATVVHDIIGVYPISLFVQGPTEFDSSYPDEHNVGLVVGSTTKGLQVYPALTGPADGGTYIICPREFVFPSGPSDIVAPRFLYEGEEIPDDCVSVTFVPECATLEPLPDGASWNHDSVTMISCVT